MFSNQDTSPRSAGIVSASGPTWPSPPDRTGVGIARLALRACRHGIGISTNILEWDFTPGHMFYLHSFNILTDAWLKHPGCRPQVWPALPASLRDLWNSSRPSLSPLQCSLGLQQGSPRSRLWRGADGASEHQARSTGLAAGFQTMSSVRTLHSWTFNCSASATRKRIQIPEFMDPCKKMKNIIYIYPKMDDRFFPAISREFPAISWEFPATNFWKTYKIHEISQVTPESCSWDTPAKRYFSDSHEILVPERWSWDTPAKFIIFDCHEILIPERGHGTPLQKWSCSITLKFFSMKVLMGHPCKKYCFGLPWQSYPCKLFSGHPCKNFCFVLP